MRAAAPRPTAFAEKAITTCGGWGGFEPEQSGCARQVAQINCGIEAARVHIQRNQTHLESLRRRYRVAWPRAVRPVSRTTARRLGQIDVACSRSGYRRGCVQHAQDRPTHRAAAGATARRLLGIIASERQPERFHFPSRSEREAHGLVVESVPGYSR